MIEGILRNLGEWLRNQFSNEIIISQPSLAGGHKMSVTEEPRLILESRTQTITLNGRTYTHSGKGSLKIVGNKVFLDDKEVTDPEVAEAKVIHVEVTGDVEKLDVGAGYVTVTGNVTGKAHTAQGTLTIRGNVGGNAEASQGNITVQGKVEGSVRTSQGEVNCGDVGQNVETTMGDVTCGNVSGKVTTKMGDINYRK